jgi:hypothetical protein
LIKKNKRIGKKLKVISSNNKEANINRNWMISFINKKKKQFMLEVLTDTSLSKILRLIYKNTERLKHFIDNTI